MRNQVIFLFPGIEDDLYTGVPIGERKDSGRGRWSSWVYENWKGRVFGFFIEVELIYSVVLISAVQQSHSVKYIYTRSFLHSYSLCFIIGYWIQFSVLYSSALLFIHSKYISLHLLPPTSGCREQTCGCQAGGAGGGMEGQVVVRQSVHLGGRGASPPPMLEVGLRAADSGIVEVKVQTHFGCAVGFWWFQSY